MINEPHAESMKRAGNTRYPLGDWHATASKSLGILRRGEGVRHFANIRTELATDALQSDRNRARHRIRIIAIYHCIQRSRSEEITAAIDCIRLRYGRIDVSGNKRTRERFCVRLVLTCRAEVWFEHQPQLTR